MIELRHINKTYCQTAKKITALEDVQLRVGHGEIVGVIGKSGAGKSTLLRCVNLLERPDSGEVWVNQSNLLTLDAKGLRQARSKIGMIFQHFNLLHSRTARGNVALPLEMHHVNKEAIAERVTELLRLVEIEDRADNYPSQLSGGQKQRVAIARALVNEPNVLLCDEITSALDPETTFSILRLLRRITSELQLSVLLITHDMDVIKTVADRVVVLDQGAIVEETDIINIFKNPQTEAAKALTEASLHCELPPELQTRLQATATGRHNAIIRLKFLGHPAVEPIIDDLIRHKNLTINIFQANLEYIRRETIGIMIISAGGEQSDIESGIQYLNEKKCQTEVLGYIDEFE